MKRVALYKIARVSNAIKLMARFSNTRHTWNILNRKVQCITLNVGGKKFCTTRRTLQNVEGSFLARLTDAQSPFRKGVSVQYDADSGMEAKEYFIDRDGNLFSYVLNYLRDGHLHAIPDEHLIPQLQKRS